MVKLVSSDSLARKDDEKQVCLMEKGAAGARAVMEDEAGGPSLLLLRKRTGVVG